MKEGTFNMKKMRVVHLVKLAASRMNRHVNRGGGEGTSDEPAPQGGVSKKAEVL